MSKEIEIGLDRSDELRKIAKALSTDVRLEIIKLLNANSLNINEISEKLNIPASSAALNVKVLEEAEIIHTELHPGTRGSMKLCSLRRGVINIILNKPVHLDENSAIIDMPIGHFVACKVMPTCGMVDDKEFIGTEDEPRSFYNPSRTDAQLIWFHQGFLEYHFSNEKVINQQLFNAEISMEICSEAPNYKNDWPSDITLWINDIECGTWTSPGDFGGRRGELNPSFWSDGSTQYGKLKKWRVTNEGFFIDDERVSDITLDDVKLSEGDFISIKIGVKEDAENVGGMNIFGESFGDYKQNIMLRVDYK
jgi:predicted transcriptional regulator